MGLDVGSRTIGVALSDELRLTGQPFCVLSRKGTSPDVTALLELVTEHEVTEIVVGLPLELDGRVGHRAERVQVLADALAERFDGPVSLFDERLSTRAAELVLLEADLSRQKRKKVVDKVAAAVILQAYLDGQQAPSGEEAT